MTKLTKALCFIIAFMTAMTALAGCGGGSVPEFDIPIYQNHEKLNIVGWEGPSPNFFSREGFEVFAEAGFSIGIPLQVDFAYGTEQWTEEMLDIADELGIKLIITDTTLVNIHFEGGGLADYPADPINVGRYLNHDAFYGIFINDETNVAYWPDLKTKLNELRGIFPENVMYYTNTCDKGYYGGLEAQLRDYIEQCNPSILSYDKYCMMDDGAVLSALFHDKAVVRYLAKEYGLTSWDFILTTGGYWSYRKCSEEDIRWQIALNMAYGYDYIQHFGYSGFADSEKLFDIDGNKTELYHTVKKVNLEAQKLAPVYNSFEWLGTAPVMGERGSDDMFLITIPERFSSDPDDVAGIAKITSNRDALLGIFEDENGNKGFMVTNATNPYDYKAAKVTVKFDAEYAGVRVYEKGVPTTVVLDKNNSALIRLEPGEGKFFIPVKKK